MRNIASLPASQSADRQIRNIASIPENLRNELRNIASIAFWGFLMVVAMTVAYSRHLPMEVVSGNSPLTPAHNTVSIHTH
jgi:hypothetical protein